MGSRLWVVLAVMLAGCGGGNFGWETCTTGVACGGRDYTCAFTKTLVNTTCVTDAEKHCVKRCSTDADCVKEQSMKGLTETCVTDCAGAKYCDGTR